MIPDLSNGSRIYTNISVILNNRYLCLSLSKFFFGKIGVNPHSKRIHFNERSFNQRNSFVTKHFHLEIFHRKNAILLRKLHLALISMIETIVLACLLLFSLSVFEN